MRSRSRRLVPALLAGAVILTAAPPAVAAETSNSEFVIIPEADVFPDDLYAGAIRVLVEGTLDGDLVVFAAEEVVIEGVVTGSVIAVSPRVSVNGEVRGSLRVTSNRLEVAGNVGGDVVAATVSVEMRESASVAGDTLVWAWDAILAGAIGGDLSGTQRSLGLAGSVTGDVDVSVRRLDVNGPLVVGGDLGYRSATPATGLAEAEIGGALVEKTPLPPNLRVRALWLLGRFMIVVFLSVAALTTAYGWPKRALAAISNARSRPVRSWLTGAVILFLPVLAVVVTGVIVGLAPAAASFPLLVVLVPLVLALTGLSFALSLVAGTPAVGWLGGALFRRLDVYGAILAGSLLAGLAWLVPLVGWLVPLLVLPLGLGAWVSTWRQPSDSPESGPSGLAVADASANA